MKTKVILALVFFILFSTNITTTFSKSPASNNKCTQNEKLDMLNDIKIDYSGEPVFKTYQYTAPITKRFDAYGTIKFKHHEIKSINNKRYNINVVHIGKEDFVLTDKDYDFVISYVENYFRKNVTKDQSNNFIDYSNDKKLINCVYNIFITIWWENPHKDSSYYLLSPDHFKTAKTPEFKTDLLSKNPSKEFIEDYEKYNLMGNTANPQIESIVKNFVFSDGATYSARVITTSNNKEMFAMIGMSYHQIKVNQVKNLPCWSSKEVLMGTLINEITNSYNNLCLYKSGYDIDKRSEKESTQAELSYLRSISESKKTKVGFSKSKK